MATLTLLESDTDMACSINGYIVLKLNTKQRFMMMQSTVFENSQNVFSS